MTRFMIVAAAATLLLLPATRQASACEGFSARAAATDLSAVTKKPVKTTAKKPKEKVEYMRSAAGPEPASKKTK